MKSFVTLPPTEMVRRVRQLRERLEHSARCFPDDAVAQRDRRAMQRELSFYQPKVEALALC